MPCARDSTLPVRPSVMVVTRGVAVGAATVIYSVIDLVWHFLPAPNQTRLVCVGATDTRVVQTEDGSRSVVMRTPASVADLADWSTRTQTFEQLAGFRIGLTTVTGVKVPLRLTAIGVTANLPDMWGLTPELRRACRTDEGRTGSAPVTMLSHTFWERQFSADPAALRQTVLLDDVLPARRAALINPVDALKAE